MSKGMISSKFIKKTRVLGMLKAGRRISDIALAENITPTTVYNWRREFVKTRQLTVGKKLTVEKRRGRIARCICRKCKVQGCNRRLRPMDESTKRDNVVFDLTEPVEIPKARGRRDAGEHEQAMEDARIAQASVRWREPGNEVPEPIKSAESPVEREKDKTVLTAEEMRKYRQGVKARRRLNM